jgi:hypothetical protein
MAEYDNAGFPLSYCLLSTATAISQGKRTKALMAWAHCLREKHNVEPKFAHVDKDMAEIKMLRTIWNAKISLCWWHLRRAVRTRLALAKITTTPYDVERARCEFPFIDKDFKPHGRSDRDEYEGGLPDDVAPPEQALPPPSLPPTTQGLTFKLPPLSSTQSLEATSSQPPPTQQRRIRLLLPQNPDDISVSSEDEGSEVRRERRAFCPEEYRKSIVEMMEKHYCAHPLIPGYAPPSAEGIRLWAVKQMYQFCFQNDLCEVWAYLWENWYRAGRWELWARAPHPEIPILKTTMILESQ